MTWQPCRRPSPPAATSPIRSSTEPLPWNRRPAGYRHDVGLQLRGGLTTGSGVGDLVDQKNTGDRNYLELIWDLLGNG